MPKIEEFNPGNLALRPSELGVDATAAAARRIGGAYNQAAAAKEQTGHLLGSGIASAGEAAVAIEDLREISTGAAKGVELFAGLVDSKDQAIKGIDPNDPAYGQKVDAAVKQWREQQLEPALDQFSQGFNTQKSQAWAEHFVDQTRTHMRRESTSDVSNAAAIGVKNSVKGIINQASNTALQNPSSIDSLLDLVDHSIGGIVGSSPVKGVAGAQMRTGIAEQAKEKIVKDGAMGAILQSSDPEATAADFIKRYPKYINGDEALQLGRAAAVQNRSMKRDEKAMMDWNHTEMTRDATMKLGKVFSDNVSYDETTGKPIFKPGFFTDINKVVAGNDLAAPGARTLAEWGSRHLEGRAKEVSDPTVKQGLLDRFTSDKPPTDADILQAEANGKLSTRDGRVIRDLRKELVQKPIQDPIFKNTMDGVKGVLGQTPPGRERYGTFFQNFVPAYLALPHDQQAKALDMSDPTSLISKTLGKPGEPGSLRPTTTQLMIERATHGNMDPELAKKIIDQAGEIGGVKPTSIRSGGQTVEAPPKVDKAGFDALPSGARFTAPDGSVRTKP